MAEVPPLRKILGWRTAAGTRVEVLVPEGIAAGLDRGLTLEQAVYEHLVPAEHRELKRSLEQWYEEHSSDLAGEDVTPVRGGTVNRPVPEDQPQASAQYPAPAEDRGAPQNPSAPGAQEVQAQEEYVPDPANTGPATSPGARHLTPAEEEARNSGQQGAQE